MLTVSGLSKAYAGRTLFADASFQVERGDRIGLVGPNGAGKSTLFAIILGHEEPDAGQVQFHRGVRVGHLPQETASVSDETVLALAAGQTDASPGADSIVEDQNREARAARILAGLGFRQEDFHRPVRTLSGGWIMRTHLARLLVEEPDLLLLDEPTNHLDLASVLWFQNYLKTYPGALVAISHDRAFLNELMDTIVEIRQGRLWRYRGNYDAFLAQREADAAHHLAAWKNQQRRIARMQAFVDRFRAKNTKASQAQSKLKQIERMEKIEAPSTPLQALEFRFPQPPRGGQRTIRLEQVSHAYGDLRVYENLEFEAHRGERIVLVGPNGAGKSTLLKLLAGVLPVQSGRRLLGHNVRCGYYAQHRVEMLDPDRTVLEEALRTSQPVTEQFVRTVLGSFLFRGDEVFKPVRVLSGGEKSRLALVKLLLDPPNLLLMDEPTTHLNLDSVEALIHALQQYEGTLIFISHDVHFIRQIANQVLEVQQGRLWRFPGNYDAYLEKTRAEEARIAPPSGRTASAPERSARREERRRRAEAIRERSRRLRQLSARVQELEDRIHQLELRQRELTAALEDPATYGDTARAVQAGNQLKAVLEELDRLHAAWEPAATELHELQTAQEGA